MSRAQKRRLCAACAAFVLVCCTKKQETLADGRRVEVTGVVRVVGSEPWTETVITDAQNTDWYLEDGAAFRSLQHKTITVRGIVTLNEIVLADGTRLAPRRSLSRAALLR